MTMFNSVKRGNEAPKSFNVIIEIAQNSGAVKYEFDDNGLLIVDRFLPSAMQLQYPCNYGAIPQTLGGDGDPLDALVYTPYPLVPMAVIEVRPVAVLKMEDEKGEDEKIFCIPTKKALVEWDYIEDLDDLQPELLEKVNYFFTNYKNMDEGKWVKISGWGDKEEAQKLLNNSIKRFENNGK